MFNLYQTYYQELSLQFKVIFIYLTEEESFFAHSLKAGITVHIERSITRCKNDQLPLLSRFFSSRYRSFEVTTATHANSLKIHVIKVEFPLINRMSWWSVPYLSHILYCFCIDGWHVHETFTWSYSLQYAIVADDNLKSHKVKTRSYMAVGSHMHLWIYIIKSWACRSNSISQ